MQVERVIRPAAVLSEVIARRVLTALEERDVSAGGVWNASASLWQRFSTPWNGHGGGRGSSLLLGSIAVIYDSPVRHEITIYKVSLTEEGVAASFSVEGLCNEALGYADWTLDHCQRAHLTPPPPPDPFRRGLDRTVSVA